MATPLVSVSLLASLSSLCTVRVSPLILRFFLLDSKRLEKDHLVKYLKGKTFYTVYKYMYMYNLEERGREGRNDR